MKFHKKNSNFLYIFIKEINYKEFNPDLTAILDSCSRRQVKAVLGHMYAGAYMPQTVAAKFYFTDHPSIFSCNQKIKPRSMAVDNV